MIIPNRWKNASHVPVSTNQIYSDAKKNVSVPTSCPWATLGIRLVEEVELCFEETEMLQTHASGDV